jgi:hypothetical protein
MSPMLPPHASDGVKEVWIIVYLVRRMCIFHHERNPVVRMYFWMNLWPHKERGVSASVRLCSRDYLKNELLYYWGPERVYSTLNAKPVVYVEWMSLAIRRTRSFGQRAALFSWIFKKWIIILVGTTKVYTPFWTKAGGKRNLNECFWPHKHTDTKANTHRHIVASMSAHCLTIGCNSYIITCIDAHGR